MNKKFIYFLIYTFLLFSLSSTVTTFFLIYFSTRDVLNGGSGLHGLFMSVATFLEWLVMLVFGKKIMAAKPKLTFMMLAISGIFRCGVIYFAPNKYVALITGIFHGLLFGILWSKKRRISLRSFPKSFSAVPKGSIPWWRLGCRCL